MRVVDVVEVLGVLDFPAPLHSVPRGGEGHTHRALYPNFLKGLRRIFHESHDLARCSARAHFRAPSACANVQTGVGPLFPALCRGYSEYFHWQSERPVGILGGETAKQHLPCAELRDGPRDCVLALNPPGIAHLRRSTSKHPRGRRPMMNDGLAA